jgi:hypothetical protein
LAAEADARDGGEHLGQVRHDLAGLLGVADDLEEVVVADEVEAAELGALPLEVLPEGLLDLAHQVHLLLQDTEPLPVLLGQGRERRLQRERLLPHFLHQLDEVAVDPLEARELLRKLERPNKRQAVRG